MYQSIYNLQPLPCVIHCTSIMIYDFSILSHQNVIVAILLFVSLHFVSRCQFRRMQAWTLSRYDVHQQYSILQTLAFPSLCIPCGNNKMMIQTKLHHQMSSLWKQYNTHEQEVLMIAEKTPHYLPWLRKYLIRSFQICKIRSSIRVLTTHSPVDSGVKRDISFCYVKLCNRTD